MRRSNDQRGGERNAVFVISVASRLVDLHPSTLRKYERCGLLGPCRRSGRLRLYSPDDISRLRQIKVLVEERGMNVAGVELALAVTERMKLLARILRAMPEASSEGQQLREHAQALAEDVLRILGVDDASRTSPGVRERSRSSSGSAKAEDAD